MAFRLLVLGLKSDLPEKGHGVPVEFISQNAFIKLFCKKTIPAQIRHLILFYY